MNVGAPKLIDFYRSFADFNVIADDPTYTLNQNYRFAVWIFPTPGFDTFPPNPLTIMLGAEMLKSVADAATGGTIKNPFTCLTMFTQKASLPSLVALGGEEDNADEKGITDFGYMSFPGKFMLPDDNKFSLSFLDTEVSPLDHFFNFWLGQTTAQTWCYADRAFTTATIWVHPFSYVKDIAFPNQIYMFFRCFPCKISPPTFDMSSNEVGSPRDVEFKFSKMVIFPNIQGMAREIASIAGSVAGSISGLL